MFLFQRKVSRSKLSIAKEIKEVNRLRLTNEKRMTTRLISLFRKAGRQAANAFERGESVNAATQNLDGEVYAVLSAQAANVVEAFAKRVNSNYKNDPTFSSLVNQFLRNHGARKIAQDISATTRKQIKKAVIDGSDEGLGVSATSKLIRERTSGVIGRSRAATIARTETHAAASYATDEATRQLGLPNQRKRWVAVGDGRTRSHHAAANGQEVGIDEPFLIRYKGSDIQMSYPHDGSGGAANNINCRCLAIYFTEEDELFDDLDLGDVEEVPQVPESDGPFVNLVAGPNLVLPVVKGIRNEDFPLIKRSEAKRALNDDLDFAEQQSNQASRAVYAGRKSKDFGKIQGEESLSDEALAALVIINKELNYFADFLGVPRVRGYKRISGGRTIADMGDGVMGFNAAYFNKYAADITKANDSTLVTRRAKVKEKIDALQKNLDENVNKIKERQAANQPFDDLNREQVKIFNDLWEQKQEFARISPPIESDWTLGSEKRKPFSSEEYMTGGMDHMRSAMYHEFGHQIHQTFQRPEFQGRVTPFSAIFESQLKKRWLKVYTRKKKRNAEFWTRYAEKDAFEWFAENFSFWAMGQNEKVNPLFFEIIQEVIDDKSS